MLQLRHYKKELQSTEGVALLWAVYKLWTIRCHKLVKKMHTCYLDVMVVLETTYMEAQQWFSNTQQNEAAELSGKLAKWFWDRQATLVNHKVSYEERVEQNQQRLENIGLGIGVPISLQEQRMKERKKKENNK